MEANRLGAHVHREENPHADAEEGLNYSAFHMLQKHYPNHYWRVRADVAQGVLLINIPVIMGTVNFVLKIADLTPGLREVVKAGGEILERWRMPRGGFNLQDYMAAKNERRIFSAKDPIPEGVKADLDRTIESRMRRVALTLG